MWLPSKIVEQKHVWQEKVVSKQILGCIVEVEDWNAECVNNEQTIWKEFKKMKRTPTIIWNTEV